MGGWLASAPGSGLAFAGLAGQEKTQGGCPAFSFRVGIVTDQYVAFRLVLLTVE